MPTTVELPRNMWEKQGPERSASHPIYEPAAPRQQLSVLARRQVVNNLARCVHDYCIPPICRHSLGAQCDRVRTELRRDDGVTSTLGGGSRQRQL